MVFHITLKIYILHDFHYDIAPFLGNYLLENILIHLVRNEKINKRKMFRVRLMYAIGAKTMQQMKQLYCELVTYAIPSRLFTFTSGILY